jgi:pimeloyl-ACP methyl ester carboxylesterase
MRSLQAERRIASGRGEIAYHAFGNGPAVLFINGLGASWHVFSNQIAHLSDRYRCLVWDYRGLFQDRDTPGSSGFVSIADHARDALAILEHEGIERAAVIGWSVGVQVALKLFADVPSKVALLLLVAGGARASWGHSPDAGPIRRMYSGVFDWMAKAPGLLQPFVYTGSRSPETFTWARRIGLVGAGIDPELFAEVARNFGRIDLRAALGTLHEMDERDLTHVLSAVDVPALVIGGDRDPFTSRAALERLVHNIPGAEYLLLPGATHYLLLDHAQHVNLRIDKFFAERGFIA